MFTPRFMPCPECGASVDFAYAEQHVCSQSKPQAVHPLVQEDDGAAPAPSAGPAPSEAVTSADVEAELQRYLETAAGRFESWLAALQVRAAG
jgi:hypothetical protein